jgi:hypothetical protein
MAKGKPMKLKMDLDDEVETEVIVTDITDGLDIKAVKPNIEEQQKWDAITLPVQTTDLDGNLTYSLKSLEAITGDEFMSWISSVMPLAEQDLNKIMRLRDGSKISSGLDKLQVRREIFNIIVKMHEQRFLFMKGKQQVSKDLQWN